MDLVYLFRAILKYKWIIIITSILAAGITFFLTRNQAKKYKSITQISTGFAISEEIKLNENTNSFFEADTKFNNAIFTFLSPSVINLLSYRLIIHDLSSKNPFRIISSDKKANLFSSVRIDSALFNYNRKLHSMEPINSYSKNEKYLLSLLDLYEYDNKSLTKNLNIYRLDRTDYIQIEFTSEDPELSAFVVNSLYDEFIRYYKSVRSTKSKESIDTLASLVVKKKEELDRINAVIRGEGIFDVDAGNKSNIELITAMEKSLTEENNKRTNLFYSVRKINDKISRANSTSTITANIPDVVKNDEVVNLRNIMNETYKEYVKGGSSDAALLNKYNQLKIEYQRKVNDLRKSEPIKDEDKITEVLLSELVNQRTDIELDIEASNANIRALETKINSLKGNIQLGASKEASVESMLKDLDLANKDYLDAKQKYNDAFDINSSSVNNYRQILIGQPPLHAEPSKSLLLTGLAGLSGLLTITFIIILFTYLNTTIKTPAIFKKTLNLPMLGMVNFMDIKNYSIGDIILNKTKYTDPTLKKRNNVFRESLRKLRYEIESSGKKIFLFTSTQKNQGKTTLIQALAYSLSLNKNKILIIDTNFNNNDLTVLLKADPILQNISDIFESESDLIQTVENYATRIDEESIFVIGSESGDYTPSEILPTRNLLSNLHTLIGTFDYVFLEGPPLNDFSDSLELVQYCDAVIAVFSADSSVKQIDKESARFYQELNGKFIGAILNKVDLEDVNIS